MLRFSTSLRAGKLRPLLPVNIEAENGMRVVVDALVDTGADVTLFPHHIAEQLGLDLDGKSDGNVVAAVGGSSNYLRVNVVLEVRQKPVVYRWATAVGFVDRPMSYAILGTRGFFEFFDLQYSARNESFELHPVSDLSPIHPS